MKKEVIIVPKGKCPRDVLAEMEERTLNSWIFLSKSVVEKLKSTAQYSTDYSNITLIKWEKTKTHPKTEILLIKKTEEWSNVHTIEASNIAFQVECIDPERILFLKMEE